jgi:PAS domain S-box-containing protein
VTDAVDSEAGRPGDAAEADAPRATVLVVDDHPENLRVLELILEPLDVDVITAGSGEEALRILLEQDVAVIVLDVRMPVMDGYETAQYVKQRERTRHVPIIFLTAMGNDREQALSGYQAGAVDYIEKPVEPVVLCAKVATFAELYRSRMQVAHQAELLRQAAAREAARELEEVRERGAQRYRELAEAMPTMVFSLDADGTVTYRNQRWDEYTGEQVIALGNVLDTWDLVHPLDLPLTQRAWAEAIHAPESLPDGRLELIVRLRRHDGAYLWHDSNCVTRLDASGTVVGWVGTATEVDTPRRIEVSQRVLSDAGAELVSSSTLDDALTRVAEFTVPSVVDWCSIDLLNDSGSTRRVAMRVDGDLQQADVERLASFLSDEGASSPLALLLGERTPQRVLLDRDGTDVGDDLSRASAVLVPLVVRGQRVGVLSLAVASLGRQLGDPERSFARARATRLASAVDAARLFHSAQERAQSAEVLDAIADGVALVDRSGIVRLWNPAAALITGVDADEIVGRRAGEVLQDWDALAARVPIIAGGVRERTVVTTAPLTSADGREMWLSVSAVGFALGVAFAFRDLTEERAVERMKSDFVATVSHELRTPLASIYGAAVTLQRDDLELDDELHDQLLDIIGQQSQQLASIVDAVLTASRLDAGDERIATKPVDAVTIAREVVDAARSRVGEAHQVRLEAAEDTPSVSADPGHLRQVLDNLLENAIKYSPEGGEVLLRVLSEDGTICYEVTDSGVGIPAGEQRRIFEKFYRVDADMALGIGGTGLGLFIVRELVRRMAGRIEVASVPGEGSRFTVTLPRAHSGRS